MKLHQIIYRDLLTIARELDRHVAFRALISSNMLVRPVVGGTHKTRLPHVEVYNRYLMEFLENKSYYMPSRTSKSVQSMVREKFRKPLVEDSKQAMDTAFAALKSLNDRMAYARAAGVLPGLSATEPVQQSKSSNSKSVSKRSSKSRPTLVRDATIAETLREEAMETSGASASSASVHVRLATDVATGIFLLAHPMLNGIFRRSVIVLTDHSKANGTKGFIVNRPTTTRLSRQFKVHPRIVKAFGSSRVRRGGPLRTDHAEILHGRADLGGDRIVNSNFTTKPDDHLFRGIDLDVAAAAVESKTIQQSDVVFINGISSWNAGQLDDEMAHGTWVAVRAPLSMAVHADKDLWRELMAQLGGEYEAFAAMPIVNENADFEEEEEEEESSDEDEEGEESDDDDFEEDP